MSYSRIKVRVMIIATAIDVTLTPPTYARVMIISTVIDIGIV